MNTSQTRLEDAVRFLTQRDFKQAHRCCVEVIQQYGPHAHAYFLLGIIHIEIGQIEKAIALLTKSNEIENRPITFAYLAKCFALKGDMQQALEYVARSPVESLSRALDLDTVGVSLSRVGLHEKAIAYFEKALTLAPANPQYHYNYAVSCKFAGKFELARKHFEKAIDSEPHFFQAHFALSDLGGVSAENNHLARLEPLVERVKENFDARLHIGHALAKEYEAIGDYRRAFDALNHAKAPQKARSESTLKDYQAIFSTLHSNLQAQVNSDSISISGSQSDAPIFVVGMPRSGTTLVERILSHHSLVASGGELQDFGVAVKEVTQTSSQLVLDKHTIERAYECDLAKVGERYLQRTAFLRQNSKHLVDKLPFNFFYIDLIRQALPNAKIVCLLRDPMDTCVGNFRQLFSIHSPYYAYAYDLDVIGKLYQSFEKWVRKFAENYPDAIRLQSYEQLAQHPETEVKELLAYCNLPWEEQCLRVENNKLPVSTASKVQVREPINTRSIGRWKRYALYTEALQKSLGIND
ncbi:tetratricopeptide repeat-containing sulfotransferase family protein [Alteromonas sp. PRIM-21]|uniref:tetratricopeptide repeat-containing sulfotransferase family protein n=1 Tax=Alteromonas sp. PRIM-21 TaxID=1454978 RepID=UPI0022B9AA1A|nr:tetratricopeptide repeat-containing sulfotransferase family protein [Alteromonas sp. PRIM-21]MCZ8530697.1 sulfotransferase [Alteromonas sp. PRIM-21]